MRWRIVEVYLYREDLLAWTVLRDVLLRAKDSEESKQRPTLEIAGTQKSCLVSKNFTTCSWMPPSFFPKTMYSSIILSSTLALWTASLAMAETIVIEAGNLYFKPQNVNASVGDVLEFHFLPNNHSVVMGGMLDPCQPATLGGFYSGFLPVSSGESVSVSSGKGVNG